MQANIEGDLSERARRLAMEIANDADIRMMPPRERKPREVVQQPQYGCCEGRFEART